MTYFADLTPCEYFCAKDERLIAVGWLDAGRPFTNGRASTKFFETFARLLVSPWQPAALAGRHECPFCISGGPQEVQFGGNKVSLGANNVFVPAGDVVFVAPSLALHYVDAHEYAPPDAFQSAVLACPEMKSMDYMRAIQKFQLARLFGPR